MDTPKQACWLVRKIFDIRYWFLEKYTSVELHKYYRNGKFSIKKLYISMRPQFQKSLWKKVLTGSKAIPKHRFILWLEVHRKLATFDRLERWGVTVPKECVLCTTKEEESMEHIWFRCDYARTIWTLLLQWLNEKHQIGSWEEEIEWLKRRTANKTRGEILIFLFTAMVYHVWAERNKRRFQGEIVASNQRIKDIAMELHIVGQRETKWHKVLEKLKNFP
ncbi:uncharacterized protein LOC142175160 [Nicotiana tabacum]|uniref:Uncharacterized protein LOC142175160 n=1 Tax=Nicotiana tabacum TaxID=4097 RepID=A0AC58TKV7_TOBAC